MKRIICTAVAVCFLTVGCSQSPADAPHPFFGDRYEPRFVLVDETRGEFCNDAARVFADSVTGVMYLYVYSGSHCGLTPLLCEDGSPMIYDTF